MTARILVADGVATTRITLKVRLSAACYEVVTACTVEQIFQQIEQARPELIILGAGFHGHSPIAICHDISADRRLTTAPILMLTRGDSRLEAMRAGAVAVIDPEIDDQMLLARVRGILRDMENPADAGFGMAEASGGFEAAAAPSIVLVADHPGRALCWRHLLAGRITGRFEIRNPDEALSAASGGQSADLYLICADIEGRGDGLRLLSELRSRQGSRDAGFVIAISPEGEELAPIALDLGAGDVLPDSLGGEQGVDAAAMSLQVQLSRKSRSDRRKAEVRRHMTWAMTDALTGLYNRRYALPKLAEIARDGVLANQPFTVFAMDLDHFKSINDRFGHAAGDTVLTEIAQRIKAAMGTEGMAARLGGEEFLGVLGRCGESGARLMAERLRLSIQQAPILLSRLSGGGCVHVTASIGVVTVSPDEDLRWPDQLARLTLERADRALMAAKATGRNRVVVSQSDCVA